MLPIDIINLILFLVYEISMFTVLVLLIIMQHKSKLNKKNLNISIILSLFCCIYLCCSLLNAVFVTKKHVSPNFINTDMTLNAQILLLHAIVIAFLFKFTQKPKKKKILSALIVQVILIVISIIATFWRLTLYPEHIRYPIVYVLLTLQ